MDCEYRYNMNFGQSRPSRRYLVEILLIRRKTLSNQSINKKS